MSEAKKKKEKIDDGIEVTNKPLQVNPIKHSQPMGAALAFMGVYHSLPLMHASQGCASYTKVMFTKHFNEPISLYNTSVSDITAILDGGDYSILLAIDNITQKGKALKPELIGLHTTGLTETKGDDVRGVGMHIEIPYCYVNTPDYEGGMQSGWALTVKSLFAQITEPSSEVKPNKLLLLPHVSMTPIEVEELKIFCESFGFETYALPDISTAVDGYLSEKQGKLAEGAITVEQIRTLSECANVITIGESMNIAVPALLEKNEKINHIHFDHIMGLEASDNFVAELMKIRQIAPTPLIQRWRGRLQDMMLDSHFNTGSSHFVVTGEPDMVVGICALLKSVGGTIDAAICTVKSPVCAKIEANKIIIGDLEDADEYLQKADLVVSNFHAERILQHNNHTALVVRGFPNYEELGNGLKFDALYEGSVRMLFEVVNALRANAHHSAE